MEASRHDSRHCWPSTYACLGHSSWCSGAYELRPVRYHDREPIRAWRNAQIDVLRQSQPLSEKTQDAYFAEIVRPQFDQSNPDQVLFTLWLEAHLIGYGGLVHIDWWHRRAEVSFLVAPVRLARRTYEEDFLSFLGLIAEVARDDLGFHRLTGETFPERVEHVRIFESFGFVREGRLLEHRRITGGFGDSLVHGLILETGETS